MRKTKAGDARNPRLSVLYSSTSVIKTKDKHPEEPGYKLCGEIKFRVTGQAPRLSY